MSDLKQAGPEWREEWIPLHSIAKTDALQVRSRLDPKAVTRYAERMKAGHTPPPIKVARVERRDGPPALYLVDGWHRMEAGALQLQREAVDAGTAGPQVLASVADMSEADARWEAAKANMDHGVALKPKELREVFRAFMKAGKNRRGRAGLLSYQDIGDIIGKPKSTIHRWMVADYPKTARRMSGDGHGNDEAGLIQANQGPSLVDQQAQEARDAIQQTIINLPAFSPTQRHVLAELLRQALKQADELGTAAPEF